MNTILSSWPELLRMAVVGTLAYVVLLVLLRVIGKRALAKLSAYDFVTTVALGSVLASAVMSKDVTIDKAVLGFLLLLSLQRLAAWMSTRWSAFYNLINNEPALVLRNGSFLDRTLNRERLSRLDVEAAIRSRGHSNVREIAAVVLETDGSISVLTHTGELAEPRERHS